MKNLKTFLFSFLGVITGLIVMSLIGLFIIIGMIASSASGSTYEVKKDTILQIDLNTSITDKNAPDNPFSSLMGGGESVTISDIVTAIQKAKENEKIKGIYIKGGATSTYMASLEPIRKELESFKESGKFIVSYADSYSQASYYLASTADELIINPIGMLELSGLGASYQFSRGMYEKLGVKFQVFKVGTFKSAVEPYIQDKMSDANREQTSSYLTSIWGHWSENIAKSRDITVEQLNTYTNEFITFDETQKLVDYKLADSLMYLPAFESHLKTKVGIEEDDKLAFASVSDMKTVSFKEVNTSKDKIAILYAEGSIVDDGAGGPSLFSGATITPKTYVTELMKLKNDKNVKAVVLRVNSPGGSAYASEQIWNAVEEVKKEKPVVVSMGGVAASGGYYISTGANSIVAEPTTITGSIGVFGLIPDGTELAKKMGVSFDEVKTHEHANFGGQVFGIPFLISAYSRGFTASESAMMQKMVERTYDIFLTRCADGRSKTKEEIDAIGQGRVWTGLQAKDLGLVDEIGGLEDAVKIAAKLADIEKYNTASYPAEKDFMTQLLESSKMGSSIKIQEFLLGKQEFNNEELMKILKNTSPIQAVMLETVSH